MTDTLVTYHSTNSPADKQWLGYIWTEAGKLDISFFAPTEEEVKDRMREFWAKDREVRDANRKKKEEAKIAAAAKAEKKQSEAADA